VTLLTLLRVSTVGALPPHLIPPTLFATQAASRFFSVSFIFTDEYVRDDATTRAKPLATSLSVAEFVFSAICGLLPLLLLPTAVFAPLAAGVIVTRAYLGNLFNRKIGGYTGDCLGAAQQISEVVMLLAILSATWRSI
jgi:adenosylcobinamide-GDP ribazoletransferase